MLVIVEPEPGEGAGDARGTGPGRRAGAGRDRRIRRSSPDARNVTPAWLGWRMVAVKPLYVLGAGVAGEVISVGEGVDPD